MSLHAHDSQRRGRSRSPGPRDRSPAPGHQQQRAVSPNPYGGGGGGGGGQRYDYEYSQPSYNYAAPPQAPDAPPMNMPSPHQHYQQTSSQQYGGTAPPYAVPGQYEHQHVSAQYAEPQTNYQARPPSPTYAQQDRPQYAQPGQYQWADTSQQSPPGSYESHDRGLSMSTGGGFNLNIGHRPHSSSVSSPPQPQYAQPALPQYAQPQQYGYTQAGPIQHSTRPPPPRPSHTPEPSNTTGYAQPAQYQYAQPDQRIKYSYKPAAKPASTYTDESSTVVTVRPGGSHSTTLSASHGHSVNSPPSPGLHASMGRLSVSGGASISLSHGQAPPGSPLLEAYHGTYQSISPMPSPIMLPSHMDDGLDDLEALDSESEEEEEDDDDDDDDPRRRHHRRPAPKRWDPEPPAKALVEALKHTKVDHEPLIDILPPLSHKQVLELRLEFKKHYKLQGQGVNIAKLIKSKLFPGAFGKACYATALGKWESEAYWANFWFQSNTSRRELLIEALFGKSNDEIREIKLAFKDKRYQDSLEKCMKAELKADKFRAAVLLVLEEKRQEESTVLYADSIKEDVRRLHEAVLAEKGGESLMIQICVTRSDAQLREVLRVYEATYRKNFAKEMLRRSTNLVGETLAHILNGVINSPVRDALLLHQAINESSKATRDELLISRLVRYHWDPRHLERVKHEFRVRYGKELALAIADALGGSYGAFMVELCRTGR